MSLHPALPWAHGEQNTEAAPLKLGDVGLQLYDQIEVRWCIHYSDDEAEEGEGGGKDEDDKGKETKEALEADAFQYRWWMARLVRQVPSEDSAPVVAAADTPSTSAPAAVEGLRYELLYEAYESFKPESCVVTFIGKHGLIDVKEPDDVQIWRKAGDTWEPPAEDEEYEEEGSEEGLELDGEEGATLPFDMEGLNTSLLQHLSSKMDSATEEQLSKLQPHQLQVMASGWRDMMDGFAEFVDSKAAAGVTVVTAEDVQTYFEQLRKRRRTE